MKKFWQTIGIITFWVLWPFWLVYFKLGGPRARVLIMYDNKVLLVKSWVGAGLYDLPGGGRHRHETMAQAAVREVREETGIELSTDKLTQLYESDYHEHGLRAHYICFSVTLTEAPHIKPGHPEITDFMWLQPSDIDPRNVGSHVPAAIKAYESLG